MKRRFRLRHRSDFERVRRAGKTIPHPLVLFVVAPNQQNVVRIGVVAGRSVGSAVERNRAKRWLRASLQEFLPVLPPGWDLVVFARRPVLEAGFWKTRAAVEESLKRAGLLP
ncbi:MULTISPECIES: ribonuclease P protein component [Anaerolinea]|uniref:ribonuclease P protein component n=1 Tax=Anaerolinea TaxID=233189 RepID=UPI0026239620|nr:ribonuclease P protein component [Anaerolinea thermophila]